MTEINYLSFLYVGLGTLIGLLICLLNYLAIGFSVARKHQKALRWLIPFALGHTVSEGLYLYDFFYRLLRLRANVTSMEIGIVLGSIQSVLALLASILILNYIVQMRNGENL